MNETITAKHVQDPLLVADKDFGVSRDLEALEENLESELAKLTPYQRNKIVRLARVEHPITGEPMSRRLARWFQTMGRLNAVQPMGYPGRAERRAMMRAAKRKAMRKVVARRRFEHLVNS